MIKRLLAIALFFPALVFAESFVAGKDYQVLTAPVTNNKQPTVTEFFSYGCPWCFKLESTLDGWLKTQNGKIIFERVPVVFHKEWVIYAKAFYTAQTLSQSEKFNAILFKAIQTDKKTLDTNTSMVDLFVSQGVDKALVQSAFENSSTIDVLVKNGMTLMAQYQVNAIPAFVVNGRYKTDLQMAQNPERLLKLLDYLITMKNT